MAGDCASVRAHRYWLKLPDSGAKRENSPGQFQPVPANRGQPCAALDLLPSPLGCTMSDPLVINDRVTIPGVELSWSAARAGGPGGQNVNKVASKVELR